MTVLQLLKPQGIAGIAVSFCLTVLLALQKGETHHWKKQSGRFEQLYRGSSPPSPPPSAIIARLPTQPAPPTRPMPNASRPNSASSTREPPMTIAPADSAPPSAGQARLPAADALTATEQAIQLDELIKWVRAQAAVDPNANSTSP